MFSWTYTYVKTHQIVHFIYVNFIVQHSYLGKSGEERIREESRGKEEENSQAVVKEASTESGAWNSLGRSSVRPEFPELNAKAQVWTWPECSDVRPRTERDVASE